MGDDTVVDDVGEEERGAPTHCVLCGLQLVNRSAKLRRGNQHQARVHIPLSPLKLPQDGGPLCSGQKAPIADADRRRVFGQEMSQANRDHQYHHRIFVITTMPSFARLFIGCVIDHLAFTKNSVAIRSLVPQTSIIYLQFEEVRSRRTPR